MEITSKNIEKTIFKFILDSNMSKAKSLMNEMVIPDTEKELGKYTAIKGIIGLNNKIKAAESLLDLGKMSRLKKILLNQIQSIWSDDFEKGYFETWINFINYSKHNRINESIIKNSINQNPSEKKK